MSVTRNDVARVAGVSSAVVSYVLNNGPRPVSAAARQRVLAAIDELGYRRNNVARSMRTRTTESIGFVLPEISLTYFSVMTHRITEAARARHLSVAVATSNGSIDVEREHLAGLSARQVDGIILMSVDPEQDFSWADGLGVPILLVDRPVVAVEGMVTAAEHLLARGCRRLGRLCGREDEILTRRRDAGWTRALEAHRIAPTDTVVARAGRSEHEGYLAARQLLAAAERPDGVIVDYPPHAPALLRAAADLGISIPDHVAVVAIEYGPAAEFTVPRLTSVDSPLDEIAELAVEAIAAASPNDRLLPFGNSTFTLNVRESSAGSIRTI